MVQVKLVFHLETGDYRKDEYPNGTPVHTHFIYISPETTEEEILDRGEGFLREAYEYWKRREFPALVNKPHVFPKTGNAERSRALSDKVIEFQEGTHERVVRNDGHL
jgi:hypothetical protein